MKRFRFQLDSLLKLRRMREQQAQQAMAALEDERQHLEQKIRDQQALIAQAKTQVQEQLIGSVDVQSLRSQAAAAMQSMRVAQRLVIELAGVHRRQEHLREQLIEASRHRRVMELLRERRFEHWKQQQSKGESDLLDELAVIAAGHSCHLESIEERPV